MKRSSAITASLLAVLAIAAFLPSLRNNYIWDDDLWLTDNPLVRDLDGLKKIWTDLDAVPEYYPLTLTTFWIEHHAWGLHPLGYHLNNIFLHAANTILLWILLRRLEISPTVAALAAAIFAVHPVQVESVAWVTERKNVLSGFFYLLAMFCYFKSAAHEYVRESADSISTAKSGSPSRTYSRAAVSPFKNPQYWISVACFLLAMLAKSVVVTLPAALLVIVWWKRGRLVIRDLLLTLPFFLLVIPFTMLSLWMQKHHTFATGRAWDFSALDRCLIAGRSLWHYVVSIFWPVDLMFIYPRWEIRSSEPLQYLFPVAAIVAIIALLLNRKRLGRGVIAGVFFFAGTLFPALGFLNIYWQQYSFVADHMLYLAMIGLAVPIAAGIEMLRRKTPRVLIVAIILAPLFVLTWRQQAIYADSETLWRATIAKNQTSWMAYTNLGHALMKKGDFPGAFAQYLNALAVGRDVPDTYRNVGVGYARAELFDKAIASFTRAIEIDPKFARAFDDRGKAYLARRDLDRAIADFREAVRIAPTFPEANFDLGRAYEQQGNFPEAATWYVRTLEIQPDNADVWLRLGVVQLQLGDRAGAQDSFTRVLRLRPDSKEARLGLERAAMRP